MNRRTFLATTGLLSAAAGCNELRGLTGQTTTHTVRTEPVDLTIGETYSTESYRNVRVLGAPVQKQAGYWRHAPAIEEAAGQFVVVHLELDRGYRTDTATAPTASTDSRSHSRERRYARNPPAAHPSPRPPLFKPRLTLHIDGEEYGHSVWRGKHDRAMMAFDVPARSATDGSVFWAEPQPPARWNLPEGILNELPRAPSFRRRSISVSGWPWTEQGVNLSVTVENTSSYPGIYRASLILEEGQWGHDSRYVEREVPANTLVQIEETHSFYYEGSSDGTTSVVFDDGDNPHRTTLRRDH